MGNTGYCCCYWVFFRRHRGKREVGERKMLLFISFSTDLTYSFTLWNVYCHYDVLLTPSSYCWELMMIQDGVWLSLCRRDAWGVCQSAGQASPSHHQHEERENGREQALTRLHTPPTLSPPIPRLSPMPALLDGWVDIQASTTSVSKPGLTWLQPCIHMQVRCYRPALANKTQVRVRVA